MLSRLGDCVVVVAVGDHRGIVRLRQLQRLRLLPVDDAVDVGLRQVHGGRVSGGTHEPAAGGGLDRCGAVELEVEDGDEQIVRDANRGLNVEWVRERRASPAKSSRSMLLGMHLQEKEKHCLGESLHSGALTAAAASLSALRAKPKSCVTSRENAKFTWKSVSLKFRSP